MGSWGGASYGGVANASSTGMAFLESYALLCIKPTIIFLTQMETVVKVSDQHPLLDDIVAAGKAVRTNRERERPARPATSPPSLAPPNICTWH